MKKQILKPLILISIILIAALPAYAKKSNYKVIKVENGGTLTGVVNFKGEVPPPLLEDLKKGKNSEFCSTHPDAGKDGIRPRTKVSVADGNLEGAVVLIEAINKGKDWSNEPIKFDFKNCDIFPKVTVIRKTPKGMKEGLVLIENHDPDILHNPHGYSKVGANAKTLFNKPLPSKGDVADVTKSLKRFKAKKDKHFFLQCDQHNFMEADARIVYNPYFSVTGKDGAFNLDQIPAGTYKVTAWHPYLGQVTQEVNVPAGGNSKVTFEFSK